MTTILSRSVWPRASRTAETVASVPELTNRIDSTLGTCRATNSACSTSISVGAVREVVAVEEGAVPHHPVDVPVLVGVDHVPAVAALDEERVRHRRPDR